MNVARIPVAPLGAVSAATVLFRYRGELRATVVAKVTFAFAQQVEMPRTQPALLATSDLFEQNRAVGSVRMPSDLAPYLERAEVVLVGQAHAPGDIAAPRVNVRLAIADDSRAVLDKRVVVFGDRSPPSAEPRPFKRMPLEYERAAFSAWNPIGVAPGGAVAPNLEPDRPGQPSEPACFGPFAAIWPARRQLGGTGVRGERALLELPDDFTWSYFQSAPFDQRIERMPRRAWVVLEGMHARHEMLQMRLPDLRAVARVYGPLACELELVPDLLLIDTDAERCTLTFRASFRAESEAMLPRLAVAVAVESPSQPIAWPEKLAPQSVAEPPPSVELGRTAAINPPKRSLSSTALPVVESPPTLPFGHPSRAESKAEPPLKREIAGAPWAAEKAKAAPAPTGTGTMPLEEADADVLRAAIEAAAKRTLEKKRAAAKVEEAASSPDAPRRADPWAPAPPKEPVAPAPKAPARVPAPSAPSEMKKNLYGKFGKGQ